jgi:O-antigen/teichoic acid export membrane protein
MLFALLLVPLTAATRLRGQALVGLQHFILGQFPELLCHPLLFLALIGISVAFSSGSFNASLAVAMNAVASGVVLFILAYLLHHSTPPTAKRASPEFSSRLWYGSALSIMLVGATNVLNYRTDILMLGMLSSSSDVGTYHVASRGAEMVLLLLMPVQVALSPIIASCFAASEFARLQNMVSKTTRTVSVLSLPLAAALVVFAVPFLSLFGSEYAAGQTALSILVAGNYLSILLGPVTLLMVMTKHERAAATATGGSLVLNLVLSAILIPIWGVTGAAIATATSKLVASAVMTVWVASKLRLNSTVFANSRVFA